MQPYISCCIRCKRRRLIDQVLIIKSNRLHQKGHVVLQRYSNRASHHTCKSTDLTLYRLCDMIRMILHQYPSQRSYVANVMLA